MGMKVLRPYGTTGNEKFWGGCVGFPQPSDKSLGYCHGSLRDVTVRTLRASITREGRRANDARSARAMTRLGLAMGDGFQQLVSAAKQGVRRVGAVATCIAGICGKQLPLAVLTYYSATEIFDPDLQTPTAGRTLLDEICRIRHGGASCHRRSALAANCRLCQPCAFCQFGRPQ
jgi:hypothetical protein